MENTSHQNSFSAWVRDQGASEPSWSGNVQPVHDATGDYTPAGSQPQPSSYPAFVFPNQFPQGHDADKTIPHCTYPLADNAWERRAGTSSPVVQVDIPSSFSPCTPNALGSDHHLQPQFKTPGLSPESGFTRTPSSVLITPNSGNFTFPVTVASPLRSPQYSSSTGISPLVGRCNITEKWRLRYSFSPTSQPQQASDRHSISQSGQDPSLGLYQAPSQPDLLENLLEFPSLHQFPSESQRHDFQPALGFSPDSTAVDFVVPGGDLPGASSGASRIPREARYNYDQFYASHHPQDEWLSSPVYHTTSATSSGLISTSSGGGALQEHRPDLGYTGYSPFDSGYGGAIAPPPKLEGENYDSLQSPLAGPSAPVDRVQRGVVSDCEYPEIVRKKGGASLALRGAADKKRKRDRKYICNHCGDSFTSRQNLNNHLNSHFQRNPYPCKYCPKVYRHSRSLNRHLNKTHYILTDKRKKKDE